MNALELNRLKELLNYDPDTGVFTWRVSKRGRAANGGPAGFTDKRGYRIITIDCATMKAHRLAWLYVHGVLPNTDIDHINGIRDDNRITNLRLATRSENNQNQRVARSDNKTGYLGVSKSGNKFKALIQVSKKLIYLGTFADPVSAHSAYVDAKRKSHPYGQI